MLRPPCRTNSRARQVFASLLLSSATAAVVVQGGCGLDPLAACREALDAEDHEAAVSRCAAAFDQTGDRKAAAHAAQAHFELDQEDEVLAWRQRVAPDESAELWSLAASIHSRRRQDETAADAYRRAVEIHRAAGDRAEASRNLYRLFYLAWRNSDLRGALEAVTEAASEARAADDRPAEAKALRGLLALRYDLGDLQGAWSTLEASRDATPAEDRSARARLAVYEGLFRLSERRFALARDAFRRALESATGDEESSFFRSIHLNLVEAHLELGDLHAAADALEAAWSHLETGDPPTALLYYRAALQHRRGDHGEAADTLGRALAEDPVPDWIWRLEHLRGLAEEARGDTDAGIAAFRRAVEQVEELRADLGYGEFRAWLLDAKRQPYEELFRLQARSGDAEGALYTVERAKARAFLDVFIRSTDVRHQPDEILAASRRLDALGKLLPAMYESPVATVRPLQETLASLAHRHVLIYFQAGPELWLLIVRPGRVEMLCLSTDSDEVGSAVARFLADPDDSSAARSLGELLLPPDTLPAAGERLYLVTDDRLGQIPFAALRRGDRFLVEDHVLLYSPSATALAAILDHEPSSRGDPWVLGDPLGDLPAARTEAVAVAARLEGARLAIGDEAGLHALAQAGDARILHLGTHTGRDASGPWLAVADGRWTASDILTKRSAPGHVVLATCAAADRPGKGIWGSLAGAFLAAGSRTVLASAWSVDDSETRSFVLTYYDQGGEDDPAAALARTQRLFLGSGARARAWAPFQLLGADR